MQRENPVFYDIMDYPVPKNKQDFYFMEETTKTKKKYKFSWDKKNKYMKEYLDFINKLGLLLKSIPFVKNIYLCNSITFNALHEDSDIDFFVVCKSNRIWLCKTFLAVLVFIFGIKRRFNKTRKKICLSFFLEENNLNLYNISYKPFDIYLVYWIAHLVTIYSEEEDHKDEIYKHNKWIKEYLPNIDLQQNIFLGNELFTGKTRFKRFFEWLLGGLLGFLIEKLIKYIWLPVMLLKKKMLGKKGENIIISDSMMKFHGNDIRKKVNFLYKLKQKDEKNS